MDHEAKITELLDRFSQEGREKAEYLINNWDYVVPGTKEILLKNRTDKKTLARICKYTNEYIHIKSWLLDSEKIGWLRNNFHTEKTKHGYAYDVSLSSISTEEINVLINWILLSRNIESYSWKIITDNIFIKTMDKSSFIHFGTVIPQGIRTYFNVDSLLKGQSKKILLKHHDREYEGKIEMDNIDTPRTRLFWKSDFAKLIEQQLPGWREIFEAGDEVDTEGPRIRFSSAGQESDKYLVDFIDPNLISEDIESEIYEEQKSNLEGGVKHYFGKRYERSTENRSMAIEIHGMTCSICGFDFEKFYGEHGRGFIEIHHNKPLSSLDEEVVINPATDLSPVCSNCHRMIHRKREQLLSVDEMKNIVNH